MKRFKCVNCTKFNECKILEEFQREAKNFMRKDSARDSFIKADKKVNACKDKEVS